MRFLPPGFLLFAIFASSPPAAAAPWIGWDLRCDSQELRTDDPAHAWRLLDGFGESAAAGGGRIVAGEAGALVILGETGANTTIYLEARSDGRRVEVSAALNRHALGTHTFRRRTDMLAWPVPPEAARRGVNVLRLTVDEPDSKNARRLIVERIGVGPLRCRGQDPSAIAVVPDAPMTLSPVALVLAPLPASGSAPADQLELSFDPGPTTSAVSVACWTSSAVHPLTTLRADFGRRVHTFLPLAAECGAARGISLMGLGPGQAFEVRARIGTTRGLGWRGRIRLGMTAILAATVLAAFFLVIRLRSQGGLEPLPADAGPPWLDVGWIVFVALLLRIAFWVLYPRPGEAGDSYEYLLRAGFLINGSADFWRDLDWHLWGHFIRPPGYFALLALLDGPTVAGRTTVIGLQLVVSALTGGVTYLLTLPLFGRVAAWCAGLLYASYLGSIATYSRILAEPLFIFLAVTGLAGVAWLAARPGWRLAMAAGIFFGLASLVRPGPLYYPPLAGLLLVPSLGWKKGLQLSAALVLGLVAVVGPWSLRNTLVTGVAVGVETVSVANLLLAHPDERVVSVAELDLGNPDDLAQYRADIHGLDAGPLTRAKGPHVGRILAKAARHPVAHSRRVAANLRVLLGPVPDAWLRWILAEQNDVRTARLTSLLNGQYGFVLVFSVLGFFLFLRQPRFWPLAAWFFFNTSLLTFFFFSMTRYREPATPVLMAFAGGAIAALVERAATGSVVKRSGLS